MTAPQIRESGTKEWHADLGALAAEAFRWWVGELAALLPAGLRENLARGRSRVVLVMDAEGDNVIEESGRRRRSLGRLDLGRAQTTSAPRALERLGKAATSETIVRADARHALRTTAQLPLAAEKNLGQVIGFEFERLTPFKRDEVYYAYRIVARDKATQRLAIELTVVPRAALADAKRALERVGLRMTGIEIAATAEAPVAPISLGEDDAHARARGVPRSIIGLGALAALLAVACLAIPLMRDRSTIAALRAQIANVRREADTAASLQGRIDAELRQRRFLIDRKRTHPAVTELLDTLTRLIPDQTYLTELDVRGGQVRLLGVTTSATALLALIDRSPAFRNAAFESSITQDVKPGRERFDIAAQIAARGKR